MKSSWVGPIRYESRCFNFFEEEGGSHAPTDNTYCCVYSMENFYFLERKIRTKIDTVHYLRQFVGLFYFYDLKILSCKLSPITQHC